MRLTVNREQEELSDSGVLRRLLGLLKVAARGAMTPPFSGEPVNRPRW